MCGVAGLARHFALAALPMPAISVVVAPRTFALRLAGVGLACALLVGVDLAHRSGVTAQARAVWPTQSESALGAPLRRMGQGHIPMPADSPAAHASTLLATPGDRPEALLAFWFAGSAEGASDVQIAASAFDRVTQHWRAARFVVNREGLGEQLGFGVRRLGNPVAWLDGGGRVHLFVVATGLGGWAAARIVHLRQSNEATEFAALAFEVERVLPLSWLWNTSFLVRNAPLPLQDGGMVLPVHFELGIKYPVALRFGARGEFLGLTRISNRRHLLQPALLMQTATHWLALMRDQRPAGRVALAETLNGGQSWADLPDTALINPDSAVAALALAPGRMFLAHNSSPNSRSALDLSFSTQGRSWTLAQSLASGAQPQEYSYPALAWAEDSLWLSYTDQRQRIAWQRFSFAKVGD